ncbi:hypothetical protein CR513_20844, partial [Mucuna pruriens]
MAGSTSAQFEPSRAPVTSQRVSVRGKSDRPGYEGKPSLEKCFNYDDYVKVRMVTYEFREYALVWLNQYIREVRDGRRRHIDTWLDLKREMRTRFVPASYAQDVYNKL